VDGALRNRRYRSLSFDVPEIKDDLVHDELESAAIEQVFRDQHARLWRSLVLWSGDPDVASDAVAEAFAQVLARGDEVRDPTAWVWRAAFKIAGGELARRSSGTMAEEPRVAESEGLVDLIRALATLTPKQRASVVLADYAGYPHSEIARVLGSSTSAVGVHVHRGRRKLRALLEVSDD
jgi:RNA polymerase sigma factor (sigma-70 family)